MKRRVIKQGNNTLTITLPRKWAEKQAVKAGDELEVAEEADSLVVNAPKSRQLAKIKIDLRDLAPLVRRTVIGLYRLGYDEVELFYEDPELIKPIQDVLKECIGFEIVQQGNKFSLVKDLSGSLNLDFGMMLRRLFLILKGLIEDSFSALKNKEINLLKTLTYRDFEINKFSLACLRHLNKNETEVKKAIIYHTIVYQIELIGDEYKKLINLLIDSNCHLDKELLGIYGEIMNFYALVYALTFNPAKKKFVEVALAFGKINQRLAKPKKSQNKTKLEIWFILKSILDKMLQIQGIQIGTFAEEKNS